MTIDIEFNDRRSGRTTRMIEWLVEGEPDNKRVLIVFAEREAKRVFELASQQSEFIERWQITTLDRRDRLHGREFTEVGIDNLELVLPNCGAPITKITATRYADPSPHLPHAIQHGFVMTESRNVEA